MMSKYIMLLICAIVFVSGYSQETVRATQNPDGSLHVQAVDFAYFDVSGNTLSGEQFNDSLKTGMYKLTVYTDTPVAQMHLVNKHPPKTENIGKEGPFAFGQTDSTAYETGKPLTSCECNFENLFANWGPRFITNHDDLQLLSCSYVETLTDTGRVALYAEKLSDPETVSARCESKSHGDESTQWNMIREFRIFPNMITIPPGKEKEAQLEFQRMKKLFMEFLHVGDKVFEIKIKYVGSEYTAYAFCRPGENRVVFDNWKFMDMRDLSSDLCE